jgi:predicted extracellular nuclease
VFTRAPQVGLFRVWQEQVGMGASMELYAISNHFSSGPETRVGQRREQAAYNAAIAAALVSARPGTRLVVGGDLNVFPRPDDPFAADDPSYPSDQLAPLYQAGLTNLWERIAAEDPGSAYTYVFLGQAQTLDQLFVSPALLDDVEAVHAAHINADWPADHPDDRSRGVSDHDPPLARFTLRTEAASPAAPVRTRGK